MSKVMWKIKGIASRGEYNFAIVPNHPSATKNGYVYEHRIVMENHLGRLLVKGEIVHHINGKRKDNRIKNLFLDINSNHAKKHKLAIGKAMVTLKCPGCGRIFTREKRETHLSKRNNRATFCSRKCCGKYATKKVDLSNNIIRKFRLKPRP